MSIKIKILELCKLSLVLFTLFNYIFTASELKEKALNTFLGTSMAVLIDVSKRAYESQKKNSEPKKEKKKKKK